MPREAHSLTVVDKQQFTPHMIRITLGGDVLSGFPADAAGDYVKLVFDASAFPIAIETRKKQLMRSYTVRSVDTVACRLVLDFVDHGDDGPASAWASKASIGDGIDIRWPGPVKKVSHDADWVFLAGDMAALPALAVNLEQLPDDAKGHAVIEVIHEADIIDLKKPDNVQVDWVVNPHPDRENCVLFDAVKDKPWLEGRAGVWLAAEFSAMRSIRGYFMHERHVATDDMYASSYWKMGDTDEGNKLAKKRLAEAESG